MKNIAAAFLVCCDNTPCFTGEAERPVNLCKQTKIKILNSLFMLSISKPLPLQRRKILYRAEILKRGRQETQKAELENVFDRSTWDVWFLVMLVLNIFRFSKYGSVPLLCQCNSWMALYIPKISPGSYERGIWALISKPRETTTM